jgi:uncharacterized protein (DUF362 family)
MRSKVAIVESARNVEESFEQALKLIGGIDDLDTPMRPVVVKVGVFDPSTEHHTTVDVVDAIIKGFQKAPKIFLSESDNYRGGGFERLNRWKKLFSKRVVPFNLSEDRNTRKVRVADEEIGLSHILFKPNIFVSTHVLRVYKKGSILKNLLGLVPDRKKARFHKKLEPALLDMCQAIGGIDLAVMDGTRLSLGVAPNSSQIEANVLLVGRDAVAVESVGARLAGMDPQKMPIIKEATRRGIGEGDLEKIEIVGASLENLKEKLTSLAKTQKSRARRVGPQTWGGKSYHIFKSLIREGFFELPNKRTVRDVAEAFESKGLSTEGMNGRIANSLARRVKNGVLKKTKSSDGWVYWAE